MNVLRKKNIEEIRPHDIDEFVNFQVGKGYKPSTVNRRLAAHTINNATRIRL